MSSQWSMLPLDLLLSISDRLLCVSDRIQFESVCTWWRQALATNHHLLSSPAPMAMILGSFGTADHTLFSIVNGSKFRIHLPETDGWFVIGSSSGWLLLDHCTSSHVLRLLNPSTRSEIELPIVSESSYISRVTLSSNPLASECFVMIVRTIFGQWAANRLSFCRIGDDRWTDLDTDPKDYFQDVAYHRGKFYAVTEEGKVVQCDTGIRLHVSAIGIPEYEFNSHKINYLVSSSSELLIATLHACVNDPYEDEAATVHVVDFGTGNIRRMKSLGNENYYVGKGHAWLSAKGSGNHIYFSDYNVNYWLDDEIATAPHYVGVFDMSKSTMEPVFEEDFFPEESALTIPLIWLNIGQS